MFKVLKGIFESPMAERGEYSPKDSLAACVGNTPLVKIPILSHISSSSIFGKLEYLNPGASPKDRIALHIINHAESCNLIKPGDTIFEGTVGSTGISLATICKSKGYKCYIVMPDDQSAEKYELLSILGATVEKTKPASIIDPLHYVNLAKRRCKEFNQANAPLHSGYFCNQFENPENFNAHFMTTGPEIYNQTNGKIDAVVLGAGTGGTIAGVAMYLKQRIPNVKIVLADPQGSGLYHKVKNQVMFSPTEAEGSRKRHQVDTIVEGVGINRLTLNFTKALPFIDDAIRVSDKEALEMSRYLLENDGFFVGSSSAVNCVAAVKVAKILGPGKTIVTLLCDHGSRHLTKFWNKEYIDNMGLTIDGNLFDECMK